MLKIFCFDDNLIRKVAKKFDGKVNKYTKHCYVLKHLPEPFPAFSGQCVHNLRFHNSLSREEVVHDVFTHKHTYTALIFCLLSDDHY